MSTPTQLLNNLVGCSWQCVWFQHNLYVVQLLTVQFTILRFRTHSNPRTSHSLFNQTRTPSFYQVKASKHSLLCTLSSRSRTWPKRRSKCFKIQADTFMKTTRWRKQWQRYKRKNQMLTLKWVPRIIKLKFSWKLNLQSVDNRYTSKQSLIRLNELKRVSQWVVHNISNLRINSQASSIISSVMSHSVHYLCHTAVGVTQISN